MFLTSPLIEQAITLKSTIEADPRPVLLSASAVRSAPACRGVTEGNYPDWSQFWLEPPLENYGDAMNRSYGARAKWTG